MKRRRAPRAVDLREDVMCVMPQPALPWGERPVRCMLGRHRRRRVWETAPPIHLFGWFVTRCARCGVAL